MYGVLRTLHISVFLFAMKNAIMFPQSTVANSFNVLMVYFLHSEIVKTEAK